MQKGAEGSVIKKCYRFEEHKRKKKIMEGRAFEGQGCGGQGERERQGNEKLMRRNAEIKE